jgi:hypothetical protein
MCGDLEPRGSSRIDAQTTIDSVVLLPTDPLKLEDQALGRKPHLRIVVARVNLLHADPEVKQARAEDNRRR